MENEINIRETLADVAVRIRELSVHLEKSEARFDREFEKSRAEREKSEARFDRELEKSRAEADKRGAEADKRRAELDRQIKELKDTVNGMSKSDGLFAEEYFFNSFENGKRTFLGETFDDITKNLKGTESNDEYDIVFINGKSVGIVEIKYRGRLDDIPKIINKANTFRTNFPKFQNHRIFLAMASMMFNQRIEDECKDKGIAIVKQAGDTVTISDEHLKAY